MIAQTTKYKKELGATLVEAAASLGLFLLVLLSGVELVLYCYYKSALDHALSKAGRYAILGVTETGLTREQAIKETLIEASREYGLTLTTSDISIVPVNPVIPPPCADASAGCGNEWIYIAVNKPASQLTFFNVAGGTREIYVRNEPF